MANYFRETFHLVEHDSKLFKKFDYILLRALPLSNRRYFDVFRCAVIEGLKNCCSQNNGYIAAVFHNVLATYYLNRSVTGAVYSADKLKCRELFIDTNVLYAMLVRASDQHEAVHYFVDRLQTLGLKLRVFPFTIQEYESSILAVEKEVKRGELSPYLVRWHPWLYQEFQANKSKYLNQVEVCRQLHSVTKSGTLTPDRFDEIDKSLEKHNVCLERQYEPLNGEQVQELWAELRSYMAVSSWSADRYYDFVYESTRSHERMAHDCNCVANLARLAQEKGSDELGPKLMFITLDRHLARVRKKYRFVMSSEQFVEFMLPYLFMSDVPLADADTFPNKLLGAHLAPLLSKQHLDIVAVVEGFFKNKDVAEKITNDGALGPIGTEYAKALSESRFSQLIDEGAKLEGTARAQLSERIASLLEQAEGEKRASYFKNEGSKVAALQRQVMSQERENKRLRGRIRVLRKGPSK